MLGNRQYGHPLTITDHSSRYRLACEGLDSTTSSLAFAIFQQAVKNFGVPEAMRADHSCPFSSPNALSGLS